MEFVLTLMVMINWTVYSLISILFIWLRSTRLNFHLAYVNGRATIRQDNWICWAFRETDDWMETSGATWKEKKKHLWTSLLVFLVERWTRFKEQKSSRVSCEHLRKVYRFRWWHLDTIKQEGNSTTRERNNSNRRVENEWVNDNLQFHASRTSHCFKDVK